MSDSNTSLSGLSLATRVTILRILGIPVFAFFTLRYILSVQAGCENTYARWAALVLFTLIAVTDALDGYLARSRNEVTNLGRVLDPIADKALMLTALVLLTRPGLPELQPQFPLSFAVLVISRDAVLVAGAYLIHHFSGHVRVAPSLAGKAATLGLMAAVVVALANGSLKLFNGLLVITAVAVAISTVQYLKSGLRQLDHAVQTHGHTPAGGHHDN